MKKGDFERFAKAFGTMAEVYDKKTSPVLQAVYFKALADFSIPDAEAGISRAMATMKFWPKPVELIEIITGGGAQNIEDAAQLEALKVIDAVRRVGGYRSVKFNDPVTTMVIKQGFNGWAQLCDDLKENAVKWFQKDFIRIYATYRRQGISREGYLVGRCEMQNIAGGFEHSEPPVLIDDDQRKKLLN